jgi:hypothetical protein
MSMDKRVLSRPLKWKVVYSDEVCDQVWHYDTEKFKNGPVLVETNWKSHILKEWKDGKKLKSVRIKTKRK